MTSPTLPDASPFGWLLADSKTGPVPLVRLGDLPGALALKRGLSGLAGLDAMCDCLRQLDAVPTNGYWWAFPDDEGVRMLKHREVLSRGLELYELRQGYARPVLPDRGRLRSEIWEPGDKVPWGYVERPGPRPCPWAEFAGVEIEDRASAHIVWTQPWPEPREGFALSWVDRLSIPEHWEHLIEAYGAVDVEGLTYGPGSGQGPSETTWSSEAPSLSHLAMRRDAAEVLWPDLFGAFVVEGMEAETARRTMPGGAVADEPSLQQRRKIGERVEGLPDAAAMQREFAALRQSKVRGPTKALAEKYGCSRDTIQRRLKTAEAQAKFPRPASVQTGTSSKAR
jgi:hypothetical protein